MKRAISPVLSSGTPGTSDAASSRSPCRAIASAVSPCKKAGGGASADLRRQARPDAGDSPDCGTYPGSGGTGTVAQVLLGRAHGRWRRREDGVPE